MERVVFVEFKAALKVPESFDDENIKAELEHADIECITLEEIITLPLPRHEVRVFTSEELEDAFTISDALAEWLPE